MVISFGKNRRLIERDDYVVPEEYLGWVITHQYETVEVATGKVIASRMVTRHIHALKKVWGETDDAWETVLRVEADFMSDGKFVARVTVVENNFARLINSC